MSETTTSSPKPRPAKPSLMELTGAIATVGATSLGGGLTGWMMQTFVRKHEWLTAEEFFSGLAVAQALPGVNVVNLSIWIGWRLYGATGAAAAMAAIVVPGLFLIGLIAGFFELVGQYQATGRFLAGAISVSVGLSLAMGLQAARPVVKQAVPTALMVLCFILAGPLRLPGLPIIVGLGAVGIVWQLWSGRHA